MQAVKLCRIKVFQFLTEGWVLVMVTQVDVYDGHKMDVVM